MTQARGHSATLSYVEEASFGVTPPGPVMRLMQLAGEELGVRSNAFTEAKDGAERLFTGAGSGHIDAGGSAEIYLGLDSAGTLLKHSLGSAVTTGSAAPYTHVISGGSSLPPGLSIEKAFNDVSRFVLFKGCRIDTISLYLPGDGGPVVTRLEFICKTAETATTSVASSSLEETLGAVSYRVSIEDDAAVLGNVLGAGLVVENNLDKNGFVLGLRERHSIGEGIRRVSGDLTLEFEDFSYYDRFKDLSTSSLKITLLQGSLSMEVFLPKIVFSAKSPLPAVKDAGPLVVPLHFVALKDPSEGTDIKITLTNNQSSI